MRLIKLSETKFVDPNSVEGIEAGKGQGGQMTTVLMKSGAKHTTVRKPKELLRDIEYASINSYEQFNAG